MKGLILKDIFCLRTRMNACLMIIGAALLIGILISLSTQYGNLRPEKIMENSGDDGEWTEVDDSAVNMIAGGAVILAILLPMGVGFDGVATFLADEKAGFANVQSTMPVNAWDIAGARFCSTYGFLIMGYLSSWIISLLISPVVEIFSLKEMIQISTTLFVLLASVLGCVIFMNFIFRQKVAEKIYIGLAVGAYLCLGYVMIKMNERYGEDQIVPVLMEMGREFMDKGVLWLLPVAIMLIPVCYLAVVFVLKRKGTGVR